MSDFDDFQVKFAERFHLEVADRTKYVGQLEQFHQRSADRVITYYSQLIEIYDNLEQLDMVFHPDQIKLKFITGLRPELRAAVPDAGFHQSAFYSKGSHYCHEP